MIIEIIRKVRYEIEDDLYHTLDQERGIKEEVLEARGKLMGSERIVIEDGIVTDFQSTHDKETVGVIDVIGTK